MDQKWMGQIVRANLLFLISLLVVIQLPEIGGTQPANPELPTEPVLRIEAGKHAAVLRRIDTDAANKFAVTASYDKTVRIWSLPDGKLQRVLRSPVDYDRTGQVFAVAMSPDGNTVAVAGAIGKYPHYYILLFDRASGALKRTLADIPTFINHLAYSPDGKRLAASLAGTDGIRVFDVLDGYRLLASDKEYRDSSYSVMFDQNRRLVSASYDGVIRLYAADQYAAPIARFEWKGHAPYSAVFSPDGTRVAAGSNNDPAVVVLSGSDLTRQFMPNTAGISTDDLEAVAWSQDGRFLYAGGRWRINNAAQVRRWSNGGRGPFVDVSTPFTAILEFRSMKSGSMLVADVMGVGIVDPNARLTVLQDYGGLSFVTGGGRLLRVSEDGRTVQIDARKPSHTYRFALANRLVKLDPPEDASLKAAVTNAPGLDITDWFSGPKPAVNGTPIALGAEELARSVAVVPGEPRFVLGADFSLRLLDQTGRDVWPSQAVPGIPWHVNVAGNRRLLVAAYEDSTIRWHRLSDGKELLALFIHPDGQRWIVWTPQGYYDASLGADELIGWHVNHGYDQAPDFYPASQFRDRFYRPDVIQRVLQTPNLDIEEAVQEADRAAGRPSTKSAPVSSLLKPVIEIVDPKEPATVDRTTLQLAYSVRMPFADDPLQVEPQVDGVKVPIDETRLVDTGSTRAGILRITIPRRDSKVSVVAYGKNGASDPSSVHVLWRGAGTEPKLTLYVLAIGIGSYKDASVRPLKAGKDADDFIALAKAQAGGLYEKVVLYQGKGRLRDGEATKEEILDALDWIRSAVTNTNDVAMVFLSGHGVTTPDQHYRFLPYDYDQTRVERTTISDSELQDYLTKIGGKKIFFFDTCFSGAILGGKAPDTAPNVDKFANELRAAENGIIVFTSSTGNELSQETDSNGVFALAVVEGMRGKAGRPEIPVIMITDLQGYVSRRVKELTNGNQKPMMAMPKTVEDFPISIRTQ